MPTNQTAKVRAARTFLFAACVSLAGLSGCMAAIGESEEVPPAEVPPEKDQLLEEFDPADPNAYLWTLRAYDLSTALVWDGVAEPRYQWVAAGSDAGTRDRSVAAPIEADAALAENVLFAELTEPDLILMTFRDTDGFPMTSCVRKVDRFDAITSHNDILTSGPPTFELPEGITNPADEGALLDEVPGIFMVAFADCADVHPDNPNETRSVLSWLAVTAEATPDPDLNPGDVDISAGISPSL